MTLRLDRRIAAAALALTCAAIYLALRAPLYNRDGYVYRLYALLPSRWHQVNPHHLLWDYIQILLADVAFLSGHPTTVPFQVFGIAVNCITLFCFFLLLHDVTGSGVFSAAGVLVVAFSAKFAFVGVQNQPYPLVFLFLVLYLRAWRTPDGKPPTGRRLVAAGACITAATFLQQAMVWMVPAGIAVIAIQGERPRPRAMLRGLVWGTGIAGALSCVYALAWRLTARREGLVAWSTTAYLKSQHSIQIEFPASLSKSVMGFIGGLVQSERLELFLDSALSPRQIMNFYLAAGAAAGLAALALLRWTSAGARARPLIRTNALFTVSLLSALSWSAFVFAWEPATAYYWVVDFFPILVCLGFLGGAGSSRARALFVACAALLAVYNLYSNYDYDRLYRMNFPPPLLAAIYRHVGPHSIFITLGDADWYGNMDYDLVFTCLKYGPRNPGEAVLEDFVLRPMPGNSWTRRLAMKIDSILDSGGRVYVAGHLFDPDSYWDLADNKEAFSPYVETAYAGIDGEKLYGQVQHFFRAYKLVRSNFAIGADPYYIVLRK